jgi:hypothetical protein
MVATTEPAQVLVYVAGAIADPMRVVLPLTHTAGANDPTQQANAPSLTFDWLGPLTFDYGGEPIDLTVGTVIGLTLDQAGGGIWSDIWDDLWSPALPPGTVSIPPIRRFTGRISDLEPSADAAEMITSVTCIGVTGEAATFQVGAAALPQQTEAQRVNALGGPAPYPVVNQATSAVLLARDPNRTGLIDALQETAEAVGSRVVENGLGQIVYVGLPTRQAATTAVELTEAQILAPVGWAQHVGGLINDVTVFYGPAPVSPATVRASVTVSNPASQQAYGRQHVDIESQFTSDDDASQFAAIVLAHWAQPFWDAPQIGVRADVLDDVTWKALMSAQLGQVLIAHGVTGSPSPPAGVGRWLIEGWSQVWDRSGDDDRLTDTLLIAVSEYERWVSDGKQPSTVAAVAAPTTAPYLTPITITATVKSQSLPVPAGDTVEVWDGSTLLGSGLTNAGGVATIAVKPAAGTRHLTVRYAGGVTTKPSDTSVTVTITPVTTTAVGIVSSDTTLRAGVDSATFTATVTPVGVTGTIRWQYQRDGGAWTDWSGQDSTVSPTTGKATATWSPASSAGDVYVWRAQYVPTPGSAFAPATSGTISHTVQHKSTTTRTYSAAWGATYQQDGDKRSDTSDLYQGYYSGTNGNQRSLAGFASMASDWDGATITKVEVRLTTPHWNSASGGTAVIGSDDATSEPGSWPSGVKTDRTRAAFDRDETRWVNITDWGKGFASGALRAIALGPGPSTSSTYYGYATGTGSDRPQIRITGEVWA